MYSSCIDSNDNYFLDRDPSIFKHVLNYLRGYNISTILYEPKDAIKLDLIYDEFDYFCIPRPPKPGYRIEALGYPYQSSTLSNNRCHLWTTPCFGQEGIIIQGLPHIRRMVITLIQPNSCHILGSIVLPVPLKDFLTNNKFISHNNTCHGFHGNHILNNDHMYGSGPNSMFGYCPGSKRITSYKLMTHYPLGVGSTAFNGFQFSWYLQKWPIPSSHFSAYYVAANDLKLLDVSGKIKRYPLIEVISDNITTVGYNMISDGLNVFNVYTGQIVHQITSDTLINTSLIWFPYIIHLTFNGTDL